MTSPTNDGNDSPSLSALKELAGKATPGEWTAFQDSDGAWVIRAVYYAGNSRHTAFPAIVNCGAQPNEANARFIAASRTALNELIEMVEGRDKEIAQLKLVIQSEQEARWKLDAAYRAKDEAVSHLMELCQRHRIDVSELIP